MTLTMHAVIGATITAWTGNPLLAFLIGLMSHYVSDAIPHGDEWVYWRHVHNKKDTIALVSATIDVLALIGVWVAVITLRDWPSVTSLSVAMFGAILPDLLIHVHNIHKPHFTQATSRIIQTYYRALQAHYQFHMFCHNLAHTPIRYRTAIGYQVIAVIGFLLWWKK